MDRNAEAGGGSGEIAGAAGALRASGPVIGLYAALVPLAALAIAGYQVARLSQKGMLPREYFAPAAGVNVALALGCGAAAALVVLPALMYWKRLRGFRAGTRAALGAAVGTHVPYWLLNAPYGEGTSFHHVVTPALLGSGPWLAGLAGLAAGFVLVFGRLAARRGAALSVALQALILLGLFGATLKQVREMRRIERLDLAPSAVRKPNVFLILVDTLRADHLGVYGYDRPTSPNLDAFAREAVVFDRAIAPSSWTRPSCAALLTGLYPPDLGGMNLETPLPEERPILPQFMRSEGYATAGIVASLHVSPIFGFHKGFDLLDNGATFLRSTGSQRAFELLGVLEPRVGIFDAAEVTGRAVEWIESRRDGGKPMFMYLHYTDPHSPYDPPEEFGWRNFADAEAAKLEEAPQGADYEDRLDPVAARAMEAGYDGEVRYFDEMFGRFVAYLKDKGLYEDALIIVTADHGEEFYEHGGWAHARTVYKEVLHVPLLIRYPQGAGGGTRVENLASLVDLAPTLEAALGAAWSTEFRGKSLTDPAQLPDKRWIYADTYQWRTVYMKPHKLIQRVDAETKQRVEEESYFQIETDFSEDHPGDPVETMPAEELEAARLVLQETYAGNQESEGVSFDPETTKQLEALGYL